jgi:uncharacterized membrane protein YraQ (UPF0718 family)
MHVRPGPAPSPLRLRARFVLAGAICFACFYSPPESVGAFSAAIAEWASIVLAALPYVVTGALAATFVRRFASRWPARRHDAIAALTVFNPGCDCALNGFAGALSRAHPAIAGFALTFAAAASPAALAVTYAAFGSHMTVMRAAGGVIAAALTAASWSFISVGPTFMVGQDADEHRLALPDELAAALAGIAFAAAAAVAAKMLVPAAVFAHMMPAGAALLGALLSPCSTADPLLAAALIHNARAQISFMLAAQCLDVRQLLLLKRHFGTARMAAAAGCAAVACALAATFA